MSSTYLLGDSRILTPWKEKNNKMQPTQALHSLTMEGFSGVRKGEGVPKRDDACHARHAGACAGASDLDSRALSLGFTVMPLTYSPPWMSFVATS